MLPAQLVWAAENETLKNYGGNASGTSSSVAPVWRGVAGIDHDGRKNAPPSRPLKDRKLRPYTIKAYLRHGAGGIFVKALRRQKYLAMIRLTRFSAGFFVFR